MLAHEKRLAKMPNKQLIEAYDALHGRTDLSVSDVRGWIMDELEKRDESAFVQWIESDENSPARFFS